MAVYAIYKMMFQRAEQTNLMATEGGEDALSRAQELLEELLRESLPMSKLDRHKELVRLENNVVRKERGVCLMMICNEKELQYDEKKEDRKLTYHPGCYVIIDNRPGVAQVAIERAPSLGLGPDKVRNILEEALNKKLEEKGLKVEINQKWKEGDFWTAVNEQCEKYGDRIKRVTFEFPNPDVVGPVDMDEVLSLKLSYINMMAKMANAAKGTLVLSSDKSRDIRLRQAEGDWAAIVTLCSMNGYNISVGFEHYGIYRNGTDYKAFSELDEYMLDEFRLGQRVIGGSSEGDWGLMQWLDEVRNATKDYSYDEKTKKRRKRVG